MCEKMRNEKTTLHSLHSLNRNTQVKCDKTCDKIIILFIFWEWRLLVEYYARIEYINLILFPAFHACCVVFVNVMHVFCLVCLFQHIHTTLLCCRCEVSPLLYTLRGHGQIHDTSYYVRTYTQMMGK